MPITQPRMLSLIGAAQDYQQALAAARATIDAQLHQAAYGQCTEAEALQVISAAIRPELLLQFPYDSPLVIAREADHFRHAGRRNQRKAEKARENRAAERLGVPHPQRGDGSTSHKTRSALRGPEAKPSFATTAAAGTAPSFTPHQGAPVPGAEPRAEPTWAQRAAQARAPDLDMDSELDLDGYIPSEPNPSSKAEIEAQAKFIPRAGFTVAAALCLHPSQQAGKPCPDCGEGAPGG